MSAFLPMIFGNSQSNAVKDASAAQQAMADKAIGEQQREFNTTQSNLQPWLQGGTAALNQQLQLLGLGSLTGPGGGASPTVGGYNVDKILSDPAYADVAQWAQSGHGDPNTPIDKQSISDRVNYWIQNGIGMKDPRALNAPTYTADDVAAAGPAAQQQTAIDSLKSSPLYQSLYRNGANTILANGSATGGLRGGNIQSSLANFGSDTLASVIQNQLQNLGGISSGGQQTGTNLGTLGQSNVNSIANLLTQKGSAQAGGIIGSNSALLNGAKGTVDQITQILGQMMGGGGGF